MKRIKKVGVTAFGVLTLAALVTGCGTSNTTTNSSSTSNTSSTGNTTSTAASGTSGKLEIFSWWTGVSSSKALKALVDVYKKQYPNVTVINEAVAGGAGSNAHAVLATRMTNNKPPGTFQVHAGHGSLLSWIQAGDMSPLNSLYKSQGWYNDYPKSLLNLLTVNGKIYAVPVDMQRANVLWYNPAIFKKYNLTAPTTFSQFFSDAKVLKAHGITPLAVANHGNWETTLMFSDVLLGTVGPTEYDKLLNGQESWTSPGVVKAANTFTKMMKYANSDYSALHWAEADQMVAQGKAAMNIMGDWAQGYFTTDLHLTPGKDFGWAPTPGTAGSFGVVSDVFGLPSKLSASQKAVATNFLKVLGSNAGQKVFNPLKGTFSPRLDANPKDYDAYSQAAMKSFQKDKLVLVLGQGAVNPGFTTSFENAMEVFLTSHNTTQFLQSVQSAAQANPLSS
ncbi:MAG: ABC transporter substrate-binding protein [Alicyclobacillaceae bacterium]|uniref:ABC transporter substrate-binding protein n=1 Tax=Alicyclobacillus sp. SP_1 TaxID=2942475 RepID=UPI00215811EA|nr:ABC transporter substrate-binding protein [Alicyclobacillus sp. SP_1]MCY0887301.1 ABC transporter substrate-binding protein [Alicyclobacillaceae bacterium]